MKLSDYIVSYFETQGIDVIFGYIGGMITHIVDSISHNEQIKFIQTYHEQTAAIAAEGYARESGKFGVAISTSGPGVTNMITGIADAYFDSIPVIYITGQVNTYEYKYAKPIRQQGFQETDVVSLVKSITKYAKLIDKAEDIRYELEKSVYIATHGRKGPVLLDIPMNVQRAEINSDILCGYILEEEKTGTMDMDMDTDCIQKLLSDAKCPLLLLGAGCNDTSIQDVITKFVSKTNIPVVTSLLGKGSIDETYPYYIGMIGSYGNRCANMSIANSDLLIALGTRLDTRQTGAQIDSFLKNGKIIHVDIDGNELEYNRLKNRIKICSDIISFLNNTDYTRLQLQDYTSWHKYLLKLKKNYDQNNEIERFIENKSPYKFIQMLNQYINDNDVIIADIGQNQMWTAQTLQLKKGQRFVTSGGLAPMGFSIPASIGIAFASPDKNIFSISGDGGFHIAVQSLMLVSQYNLPVKIIVMNNNALGMITQFQHLYFDDRMVGTTKDGGYEVPDIKNIAEAYKLSYFKITEDNLSNKLLLDNIFSSINCIIEYQINGLTTVSPKLEFDKPIDKPTPLLSDEEQKMNIIDDIQEQCYYKN
ncbi:MAG: thiamine pyrophosphate-binding protein [Tannerellaceae bacterium]|jgi:acetolactate synthase-1/2/3 large subunit|nr:thiamine pyrophosphate-binding protein [Tannerellaceae bacterium]